MGYRYGSNKKKEGEMRIKKGFKKMVSSKKERKEVRVVCMVTCNCQ
jgi:hypothetical protein